MLVEFRLKLYIPLLFAMLFALYSPAIAQVFRWSADGYTICPGGTFKNIGGTDLDITIEGLSNCYERDTVVHTGINNFQSSGHVDTYTFTFSKPVSVHFKIGNITYQEDNTCHYDYLEFSGGPNLLGLEDVHVDGNVVIPTAPYNLGYDGRLHVSYINALEFTITHGRGFGCNPGFIRIYPLWFSKSSQSTGEFCGFKNGYSLYPTPVDQLLTVRTFEIAMSSIELYNELGALVQIFKVKDPYETILNMGQYATGPYFLRMVSKDGCSEMKKILVVR